MAPEQLEGKEADARTDLWALGAILYEMLTGKRAFAGDSEVSLIGEHHERGAGEPRDGAAADAALARPRRDEVPGKAPRRPLGYRPGCGRRAAVGLSDERCQFPDRCPAEPSGMAADGARGRGWPGNGARRRRRNVATAPGRTAFLAGAGEPRPAPSRRTERRRGGPGILPHARRIPHGARLGAGRAGPDLRGSPRRNPASLRAQAGRGRGAPTRGY